MTPRLIGLAGFARAGKDTVGEILADDYGYERRAFADKLRQLAWSIWPHWAQLVADIGYERAKEAEPNIRRDLVALGAGARVVLSPDVWLDACLPHRGSVGVVGQPPTVVTDVRYPNEAQRIIDLGGAVIYIWRPGIGPANHEEERSITALRRLPHHILVNDGDIADLTLTVCELMRELSV